MVAKPRCAFGHSKHIIYNVLYIFLFMKKLIVISAVVLVLLAGCIQEKSEFCKKKDTGEEMSIEDATAIAVNSECAQGALKETHFCNEITGTWWIDLDIPKEGCAPACVVNVATKQAEINWRCTGAIPPE